MGKLGVWISRTLNDPQILLLLIIILGLGLAITVFAHALAPILVATALAYMLEGPITRLRHAGVPHVIAVVGVFVLFLILAASLLLLAIPLVIDQAAQLLRQLPTMVTELTSQLSRLPERFPEIISQAQAQELIDALRAEIVVRLQQALGWFLGFAGAFGAIATYMVLVPILAFLFLADDRKILTWLGRFLPRNRQLVDQIWRDIDDQLGKYLRGKALEILIVGVAAYAVFMLVGLDFAALLALITGLSVLVPVFGALAVTVPVAVVAWLQSAGDVGFIALAVGAYTALQMVDGNVLQPLMFGRMLKLHPAAILVAVVFFGGLFGFVGILLAVPLATVVRAVLIAWPRRNLEDLRTTADD